MSAGRILKSLMVKRVREEKDFGTMNRKDFRYYILICILMIIFLGRMLKEYKDSERVPKEV